MTATDLDAVPRSIVPAPMPQGHAAGEVAFPRAVGVREYVSGSGAIQLAISLAILVIFLPTLVVDYAFSDDYPVLYIAEGLGSSPWFGTSVIDTVAASGRPLAGVLDQIFFSAAGTIDNLRFVRLAGVIGIVALALLVHWALVRSRVSPTFAALIAVLICSQPAFQVFGSWAVLFNVPYGAILGGAASLVLSSSRSRRGGRVTGADLLATVLLLAALFVYQSAAMFFWVFLAIALIGVRHHADAARRLVRSHAVVASVALAVAFVTTKVTTSLLGASAPNTGRTALVHDVIGKAQWFVRGPLDQSLNVFDLTPSPLVAVIVASIAIVGIFLLLDREGIQSLFLVGVGAALIPLSFLPSLVVAENSPTYRVQVALSSLIVLYASLGALGIWFAIRDRLRPRLTAKALVSADRLALAAAFVLVGASVFVAARNVLTLMVLPQSTELRLMRQQVAAVRPDATRVAFVQLGWDEGPTGRYYSDELGLASAARPWTPEPAVHLILREQGRLLPEGRRPIVYTLPWDTTSIPNDVPVINLRELGRSR